MDSVKLPDIFDYLDYRAFLRERLVAIHCNNSRHSQRWVAKNAGFQSLHLLSMILSGARHLAKDKLEPLAKVLKLSVRETEYFQLIHELSEATHHAEQQSILRRIQIAFKNGMFSYFGDDAVMALSTWYLGAIAQLTVLPDFQDSPSWVASRLGLSEEEAQDGLHFLKKHNFLSYQDNRLTRSQPSLHNFGKLPPMAVASYHMQIFEKAYHSLSKSRDQKYVESLTLAIPREHLPKLTEKIKGFCREFDLDAESTTDTRTDVWQLAIAFFTLTPNGESPSV